jgi:enoyl-CoA hydratase/carnithine racemase
MEESGFSLAIDSGIARLTLARPAKHNALGAADVAGIRAGLAAVAAEPSVRALLLTGTGEKSFCSGASLTELAGGTMSGELFSTLTDALGGLEIPTVCALNGDAWGGGAELALCCDYRLGVAGMRLRVPASRIGLCYPVGGLQRYVERLGLDAATRILVGAEAFDDAALLSIGFLHRIFPRERLAAEAQALAGELAALAPLPVRAMKRILGQIARGSLDHAGAKAAVEACAASADLREGLAAQHEKRSPRFSGA